MAARNADSMTNAQGEFHPRQPRSEPLETGGHQPGLKTSPLDSIPTFNAETLPPGTAPPESTYMPNPDSDIQSSTTTTEAQEETTTGAADTLGGATSADVHQGLGHPGQGQTSTEVRHDGKHTATKERSGLEGAGASGGSGLHGEVSREFGKLQEER